MTALGAVILAAGFGTRLAPLTDVTPKPLLDVGGLPVASRLVDRLSQLRELERIVVIVNDQHPDQWHEWHRGLEIDVEVVVLSNGVTSEAQRLGALTDLTSGLEALESAGALDYVVVVAGDNLLDEDLQPHVRAAVAASAPVVLCRDLGDAVPPARFGEITTDAHGVITRFREKPAQPESSLAATCTYVLPAGAAGAMRNYLATGDADSPGRFIGWWADQRPVLARTLSGRYFDIGNHTTLAAARQAYPDAFRGPSL